MIVGEHPFERCFKSGVLSVVVRKDIPHPRGVREKFHSQFGGGQGVL